MRDAAGVRSFTGVRDPQATRRIEQRLLDLAYTTDARLTAGALAYFAPCSIEDAAGVLEELAGRDRLRMTVEDDGTIVYELPGRARLDAPAATPALVRHVGAPLVRRPQHVPSPLVAAALSFLVPGAGQLYARHVVSAIVWFFVVTSAYVLILPGLVLHLCNIVAAATVAARDR
jgi:hypothetical protein